MHPPPRQSRHPPNWPERHSRCHCPFLGVRKHLHLRRVLDAVILHPVISSTANISQKLNGAVLVQTIVQRPPVPILPLVPHPIPPVPQKWSSAEPGCFRQGTNVETNWENSQDRLQRRHWSGPKGVRAECNAEMQS